MPSFDIVKEIIPDKSFRVSSIMGKFDIKSEKVVEEFSGNIEIENEDWQIGVIVGGSGTGKTTIAKEVFKEKYFNDFEYNSSSILDDFPDNLKVDEITKTFNSVGFSSPPSWLKPYCILSNGEKMRVDLARLILTGKDLLIFDEFTSVVDRVVAQIGSKAINKAIKRTKKKFVAITCHYDIIEWLSPDWIFDTSNMEFKNTRGLLRQPKINIEVQEIKGCWERFRRYHYLNSDINKSSRQFVGFVNGNPVCFLAVNHMPSGTVRNGKLSHRLVVLPEYQGVGIGSKFQEYVADVLLNEGFRFYAKTAQTALINHRKKSPKWRLTAFGRTKARGDKKIPSLTRTRDFTRNSTSWEYLGDRNACR